jgi:hypothetical protein
MILALRQRGSAVVPYAIVLVIFPVVYYVTHVFSYYRHPTEPVMFLLAAYAGVEILGALTQSLRAAHPPVS